MLWSVLRLSIHLSTWVNRYTHCWHVKCVLNSSILFIPTLLYTWLNGDAHHVVLNLFRICIFFQRNTCSMRYAVYSKLQLARFNNLHLFVRVLQLVQIVEKIVFSTVRFSFGRVWSCSISYFGNRCFSSIRWRVFLHPFPLVIICNRLHIVWEGSNNTWWFSYRLISVAALNFYL